MPRPWPPSTLRSPFPGIRFALAFAVFPADRINPGSRVGRPGAALPYLRRITRAGDSDTRLRFHAEPATSRQGVEMSSMRLRVWAYRMALLGALVLASGAGFKWGR